MCLGDFSSLPTECRLLITFANRLDPDQSGSNLFDTLMVFLKESFIKIGFEKNQQRQKSGKNFQGGKELTLLPSVYFCPEFFLSALL